MSGHNHLDDRIREAERELFANLGVEVDESMHRLSRSGVRVRMLSHGSGPSVVLLHGVALSAAVWAPLFVALPNLRLHAVDLPGHGLSDPMTFTRGTVRQQARGFVEDILDALELDAAPVVAHSLGGMFALWHAATGSRRISRLVVTGAPAVALAGTQVRMPLALLDVPGLGEVILRTPMPARAYQLLLKRALGRAESAALPEQLAAALSLSSRRAGNARSVASVMHAINHFRTPRAESALNESELAAIMTPTTFVLGQNDPYLTIERARASIRRISNSTLHQMNAGHAPWLADPAGVARLIGHALATQS